MITSNKNRQSKQISRCNLDQFLKSIEAWEIMAEAACQNGEAQLASILTKGVADLRKILRLIESDAHDKAFEAIYDLDIVARDQFPDDIYNTIVQGD